MVYPKMPAFARLQRHIILYSLMKHEQGARGVRPILRALDRELHDTIRRLRALPTDRAFSRKEPDILAAIRALRPKGPRRLAENLDLTTYRERLAGAFLGRCAGCTLGSPIELWLRENDQIGTMQAWAREVGDAFPPVDYWSAVPMPDRPRYPAIPAQPMLRRAFARGSMDGVPVDDDIAYTLIGLLIMEEHGPDYSTNDVAATWVKYLPHALTAEKIALRNFKQGVPADRAAIRDNPWVEHIGADIRADPWGYLAPGWPERAAEMAWRDARFSHRRNGIYGAMFFAAAIAASFTVDDPVEALRIGLTEIPRDCSLARALRWALKVAPEIHDYREARAAVDKRFGGMWGIHTINNACLTVWGLTIGGRDFTTVISETVAMGLDNDCTAATAGSIAGAVIGKKGIAPHWHRPFGDTVHSYLIHRPTFRISDILRRFEKQALRVARAGH